MLYFFVSLKKNCTSADNTERFNAILSIIVGCIFCLLNPTLE